MKVVVVLCAVLPFTGRPLLTGPWLLNSKFTQHSLQGTRQKWTGLSHHAQPSMCTSRDKMAASGVEFSVLIECEFVAVVSWKVGWLCFFNTKFALVRSDDWWVSFTRPWAVFTRLGRPDEWLVRTLHGGASLGHWPNDRFLVQATSGSWFNIKMSSDEYRKSHCGDKTVVRLSYFHNGISYAGKKTSLYWIGALVFTYWFSLLNSFDWTSELLCIYIMWFN